MQTNVQTNRRGFVGTVSGWVLGALAATGLVGCDTKTAAVSAEADRGMHGPIRVSEWALNLPEAPSAMPLFEPYTQGEPFLRRWAIARVGKGPLGQMVVVVVDTETGGHAEIEVYAYAGEINPISHSEMYALTCHNGGRGDLKTPRHMRVLADRLVEIVASNEQDVFLDWDVPTLREANLIQDARDGIPDSEVCEEEGALRLELELLRP